MAIRILRITLLVGLLFALSACGSRSATPAVPTQAGLPNPASVFCEGQGGRLEIRTDDSGGQVGICLFADGSACDEWAYFRGECAPGVSLLPSGPSVSPATGPVSPTSTAAFESPSPSRSVKATVLRVAYFKGGRLMLWTEGKGTSQLATTEFEQARISDDGQWIAYVGRNSVGVYGVFAVNANGSNERLLVGQDYLQSASPAGHVVSLDFAPASHTLYFLTDEYDLHRVSAAANEPPAPILGAGEGGFFSFSPDGQWMTLYHPNELVLAHPDGSGAHVAFQYPEDFRYTMVGPEIVWKPDSLGFHIASASGLQGSPDSMTIWFVSVAGGQVKQMSYAGPYAANLSPDGRKVVYVNDRQEPVEVHVVAEDGKDTTYNSYLSRSYVNLSVMGWSPDSKRFLLNLSKDGRLANPYLCAAGEQPIKLTDTEYANSIRWVDEDRFLFVSHGALRLQRMGEPSNVVDRVDASWYDYATISP